MLLLAPPRSWGKSRYRELEIPVQHVIGTEAGGEIWP